MCGNTHIVFLDRKHTGRVSSQSVKMKVMSPNDVSIPTPRLADAGNQQG